MGLLSGDTPDLKIVGLDTGTQKMIGDVTDQAGLSNKDIAAKYNSGVGAAGGQAMQSDEQGNQRAAQTGENANMMQAIRNQYNSLGSKGINSITTANDLGAPMHRAVALDLANKAVFAQGQVDLQNNMALMNANMNSEIARANVLYGVLSGAGTMAGAYMGGRGGSGRKAQGGNNYNQFAASGMDPSEMERESFYNAQFNGGR